MSSSVTNQIAAFALQYDYISSSSKKGMVARFAPLIHVSKLQLSEVLRHRTESLALSPDL